MGDVAGHILHRDFYRDMAFFFLEMGQRSLDYQKIVNGINDMVATSTHDGEVIANHTIPQEALSVAHDQLLEALDDRLFYIVHLIKIQNFIPHIADHFRNIVHYNDPETEPRPMPEGEWKHGNIYCHYDFDLASDTKKHNDLAKEHQNYWEIDLPTYAQEHNMWQDFATLVQEGYTILNSLRYLMSPQTIRDREDDITRDPFSTTFLYGRETPVEEASSRVEFQYFNRAGVTLGLFQTSPKVAKWIAEQRKTDASCQRLIDHLKSEDRGGLFPAFYLKAHNPDQGIGPSIKRQFSREISGVLPETGIFLGYVPKTPKKSQPRLVYSS